MAVRQSTPGRAAAPAAATPVAEPLAGRLGIDVPHGWWASAPLLKSYEAAGFDWVQLQSPGRAFPPTLPHTEGATQGT